MRILNEHPIDWILHFAMMLILQAFSGINWPWSIAIILAIEIDQALTWSDNFLKWFTKIDTCIDIIAGLIGVMLGFLIKCA